MDFQAFSKIPRLSRPIVITEKIDGTNGQILIFKTHRSYNGEYLPFILYETEPINEYEDKLVILAGSRTKWVIPGNNDNAGFAGWVKNNAKELIKLGEGRHYGEWWGQKIQRAYDLKEKRFSLFNTSVWNSEYNLNDGFYKPENLSTNCIEISICHVVPVLYHDMFSTLDIEMTLSELNKLGSQANKGFNRPEGIVIYHVAGNLYFKKTIEKDESPKGVSNA